MSDTLTNAIDFAVSIAVLLVHFYEIWRDR